MTFHLWSIYLCAVAAIIITPGPSAILCMTHGVRHGARRTLGTVLGGMLASLSLMMLSAAGLGAAIAASQALFLALKWLGAGYLIVLGISIWRSPAPSISPIESASVVDSSAPAAPHALFRRGFLVGIGNPKDMLFFAALFPQFLDASAPMLPQLSILAATWLVIDGLFMTAYANFGSRLSRLLARRGAVRCFNRLSGSAFITAGAALATAQR